MTFPSCTTWVNCIMLLLDSLRVVGDMAEDHGAPKAGPFHSAWTRGRETKELLKSVRCRVRSFTMRIETRGVRSRMTAGAD